MTDRVRAELHRSGGFAGRAVHVRADSTQLPPADAARLVQLIEAIDLGRLGTARPPLPAGADLMSYELTIERGGRRWHGSVADPAVPAELRPLIEFLTTLP
ncbi:protealysin inhibitor emfourin [Paractinoplanes rishiriensis]|uniref:Uncharacterized protein n=1 Tax=Paractinoplanes rishiriensis TaxID=1050105 RepID=A0A919K3S3_9ACTN|nr:protealysin inhibitor emfourin [Actinoplanes rishiriensis]GIE98440.1 hypothetical protein Ari01nite_59050 [Actinoplanes rishiriensis]